MAYVAYNIFMEVATTLVTLASKFFIPYIFTMDFKCAHYISKCISLIHKPNTKCHLGWTNERYSTLKVKPKHKIGLF
jgi:hypothetical protein